MMVLMSFLVGAMKKPQKIDLPDADDKADCPESCKLNNNNDVPLKMSLLIPKGLPNLGNTCFFNSVMQCLMNSQSVGLYLEHLKQLEQIVNEHNYSTKIADKPVDVPEARFQLPNDFPMPLTATFESFYTDFRNDGRPCPRPLFAQICRRAVQFRGGRQQDAHELLRYLLDGLRQEEVDRFKKAFARIINISGERCETKEQRDALIPRYKAYLEGPARPIMDAVFGGVLQQSIKCRNCSFISIRYEPFFDLSLPLQSPEEESHSYMTRKQIKQQKKQSPPETGNSNGDKKSGKMSKHQKKKEMKSKKKKNNKMKRNRCGSSCTVDESQPDDNREPEIDENDGEEENEGESHVTERRSASPASTHTSTNNESDEDEREKESATMRCVSRLADEDDIIELAESKEPTTGSLSVLSALRQFIMPETLAGSNAYECEKCCARKKGEISSNANRRSVKASKRYLISKPPLVLTLHLKRFMHTYMLGRTTTRKFRTHVDFSDTLNLAPFCRKSVKCIGPNQKEILYSLYGIVSHFGDLNGGHYVAYVRARPQMESVLQRLFNRSVRFEPDSLSDVITEKCKGLSLQDTTNKEYNNNDKDTATNEENGETKPTCNGTSTKKNAITELTKEQADEMLREISSNSKWYNISDSSVHVVPETRVFGTEAYILFYERVY